MMNFNSVHQKPHTTVGVTAPVGPSVAAALCIRTGACAPGVLHGHGPEQRGKRKRRHPMRGEGEGTGKGNIISVDRIEGGIEGQRGKSSLMGDSETKSA